MPNTVTLAHRLRSLRLSVGLTIDALAERARLSPRTISDIERGVSSTPQQRTLDALAEALTNERQARSWLLNGSTRKSHAASFGIPPHDADGFIGREQELDHIGRALRSPTPLAVIVGAPGIGKTALALEGARRAVSALRAVLYVNLAGHTIDPVSPLRTLQSLLRQLDPDAPEAPTLALAAAAWRACCELHTPLVVVDDVGDTAPLAMILEGGPRSVIATSRQRGAVPDDAVPIDLRPLTTVEGVSMLRAVLREHQFDPDAALEIVSLCGGSPLALRIVSNRIISRPATTASDLLVRLRRPRRRLSLLVAGDLSIDASIGQSYESLRPSTAGLFRTVSVLGDAPFDIELAAATAGRDLTEAADALRELRAAGLIDETPAGDHRLPELHRLYAGDRLEEADGSEQPRRRVRRYLNDLLDDASAALASPTSVSRATTSSRYVWMRRETARWVAALTEAVQAGEHARVVKLAANLAALSFRWPEWGVWTDVHEAVLGSARALGDLETVVVALTALEQSHSSGSHDDGSGASFATQALHHAYRRGDDSLIGRAQLRIAVRRVNDGDLLGALPIVLEAHRRFDADRTDHDRQRARAIEAVIRARLADKDVARRLLASLALDPEAHAARHHCEHHQTLGHVIEAATRLGDTALALRAGTAQIGNAQLTLSDTLIAEASVNRAETLIRVGRVAEGAEEIERARRKIATWRTDARARAVRDAVASLTASSRPQTVPHAASGEAIGAPVVMRASFAPLEAS